MTDLTQFGDDAESVPVGDTSEVARLARDLAQMDSVIEALEYQLTERKARRKKLAEIDLPAAFDNAKVDRMGIPEWEVDVVLKPWVHANLPKDPALRQDAIKWLDDNGHADILRVFVSVEFQKGDFERARALEDHIREWARDNKVNVSPTSEETVPWNTLTAFIKGLLEKGEVVPLETLGAAIGRVAKVEQRKKTR
jgi:hypothetical protein